MKIVAILKEIFAAIIILIAVVLMLNAAFSHTGIVSSLYGIVNSIISKSSVGTYSYHITGLLLSTAILIIGIFTFQFGSKLARKPDSNESK